MTRATPKKKTRKPNTRWHGKFLAALRQTRSVSQAAAVAGVSRETAYRHRREFPQFDVDWQECYESNIDDLEASALRRAIEGVDEPVFHQGVECGFKRRYETALTIFMLKAHRPDRYQFETAVLDTPEAIAARIRAAVTGMDSTVPSPAE
jgi:hypothetical protein